MENFNAKCVHNWEEDEYWWPMKTKARLVARGGQQMNGYRF